MRAQLALFANLLHERRIVVASASLSRLSVCVHALAALLYPFEWTGVFVPVLPDPLLCFTTAPMPFVIGVLAHQLPELQSPRMRDAMEQVVLFDIDGDAFLSDAAFASDVGQLPQPYRAAMAQSIERVRAAGSAAKAGKQLARPFLAFFVQVNGRAQQLRVADVRCSGVLELSAISERRWPV